MQKAVPLLLLLVATVVVVALFATGVIDLSSDPGDVDPIDGNPGDDIGDDIGDDDGHGGGTRDGNGEGVSMFGRPPEDRPPLQELPIERPVNVLFLVGYPQSFNAYLAQQWRLQPNVSVRTWTAPPPATAGSGPPPGANLPGAWDGPPEADTLRDLEIDIVAVHDLDPAFIEDAFWDTLHRQVQDEHVGLLVVAGQTTGQVMLDHPGLRRLLPVKTAEVIQGPDMPGILPAYAPFRITKDGARHPATRLVPWPTWSRRIWESFRLGDRPWGTPFCYPVSAIVPGAATLLEVETLRGPKWPAIIVGPSSEGRVIWLGIRDFGPPEAYADNRVLADRRILLRNLTAWLSDN